MKYVLAKMGFACGSSRHGAKLVEYLNVIDWAQQGCRMEEVRTLWDESLVDFHRALLAPALNGFPHPLLRSCSSQYARAGGSPEKYYREFELGACLADGILFEDFLLDKTELPFTRDIVLPAFDAVVAAHGMKPLIVRLSPPGEEESPHWFWYPGELKKHVQKHLENHANAR